MIRYLPEPPAAYYEVRLGHASVVVVGHSEAEAIRAARLRLSDEMPRLWDLIHRLDASRFHVQRQT